MGRDARQDAIGPAVYRVGNVRKAPCDGGQESLREWEAATGQTAGECMIHDCSNVAEVGGHVYVRGTPEATSYTLPICAEHRQQLQINCERNECTFYITTNTFLLPLAPKQCVDIRQSATPLAGVDVPVVCKVKELRGAYAEDLVFNGTDIGAVIMFAASWCGVCRLRRGDFVRHAERSDAAHYVIKDEGNEDLFRRCNITSIPTFLQVTGPGELSAVHI